MCFGAPSVPKPTPVPVMQAAQVPDGGTGAQAASDQLRRRMGLAALVLPQNAMGGTGAATVSAAGAPTKTTLGA